MKRLEHHKWDCLQLKNKKEKKDDKKKRRNLEYNEPLG